MVSGRVRIGCVLGEGGVLFDSDEVIRSRIDLVYHGMFGGKVITAGIANGR